MRQVVPIRLGDCERRQITAAAARRGISLSAFVRAVALQASAIVEREASVRTADPPAREIVLVDSEDEPVVHIVDGEPITRPA